MSEEFKKLGQYILADKIGDSITGAIYEAYEPNLDRYVAIKLLYHEFCKDEDAVEIFRNEARIIANINHPNIIQIYSIGEKDDQLFFAMELVSPPNSIKDIMVEGAMSVKRAAGYIIQAAKGLDYAFKQKQIIHRDIKPANLMVTDKNVVKIMDFGLARIMQGSAHHTSSSMITGTPLYISPECVRGEGVDHRSDIYSLGAAFFHMITGRPPFEGKPMEVITKHLDEKPPDARSFRPDIPESAAKIINRMIRKDKEERYGEYKTLIRDLEKMLKSKASPKSPQSSRVDAKPKPKPKPLVVSPRSSAVSYLSRSKRVSAGQIVWLIILLFIAVVLGIIIIVKDIDISF
jgi:serine/threonine protein kinase